MTNEHTSLEKYTSHTLFSKALRKGCVREVSGRRSRLQHIDPKFLCLLQHFFLILLGCSTGGHWEPQALCLELVLTVSNCNSNSNCNWLQLTQAVCGTWLYNCLTSTCFLWASQLHRIQPVHRSRWYSDIFDQMHLFFDWRLVWFGLLGFMAYQPL